MCRQHLICLKSYTDETLRYFFRNYIDLNVYETNHGCCDDERNHGDDNDTRPKCHLTASCNGPASWHQKITITVSVCTKAIDTSTQEKQKK